MELQHFSHDHPLILLKESEKKNKYGLLDFCSGCGDPVHGPSYSCNQCSDFTLHKSCAELPHEMHHPLHYQHPLILHTNRSYRCDACYQKHNRYSLFSYHCSQCDFHLDLKCASNWRNIIESESHDHNFTVLRKPKGFICDACGEPGDGTFYLCSICQLLVHKECTSLPNHIKVATHQHPLVLTWFLQSFGRTQLCKLCYTPMGENRADYSCQPCSYIAHFRCAKHVALRLGKENHDSKLDLILDPVDQMETESAARQIKHFSHQHFLALITHQNDDDRINTCEACIRPITAKDAFYRCTEEDCHFFLHKTCAQLPTKRLHPVIHWHQLTLLPRAPSIGNVFECGLCKTLSQGFAYYCDKCNFYYDLQCSMLSDSLTHEAHQHPLLFNRTSYRADLCNRCGVDHIGARFRFSCATCDFHLCVSSAKLPLTASHRYDNHPLKLTYHTVENELHEYYCQICEGTRNPKHWFYYCEDCDFDCHLHCVLGRYPQVKLGSTYKLDSHPHPLTLVDKRKPVIPSDKRVKLLPCQKCGRRFCLGLVFECSQCHINIHQNC